MLRYCVEKGSVAVEGVSLTVAEVDEDGFAVALVPHTLAETTLGSSSSPATRSTSRPTCSPSTSRSSSREAEPLRATIGAMSAVAEPHLTPFSPVEEALDDVRQGKFVVVVDDPDRENEGDLVIAAQFATPEAINFMATHARGLICLSLTEERADELALRPMTEHNEAPLGTAFTVSIEAREGVTTGISAADRSHTIQVAIDPTTRSRATSSSPDTSFRCAPRPAACSSGSARPRPPSTSRGSPA